MRSSNFPSFASIVASFWLICCIIQENAARAKGETQFAPRKMEVLFIAVISYGGFFATNAYMWIAPIEARRIWYNKSRGEK
jgi:hypothetical protein